MEALSFFNQRIEQYFGRCLGWGDVTVLEARRLAGGISRETWRVHLAVGQAPASHRHIVLRLDPASSLLESNRNVEYAVLRAFEGLAGFPVARTVCNEDDPRHLGLSFMASEAVPGVADIAAVMHPPYREVGGEIALNHFRALGMIATLDHRVHGLQAWLAAPQAADAASAALGPWERSLQEKSLGPSPITAGAIRWLKRHMPRPPLHVAVVHGDYRLGNCLYEADGRLTAVLDWEMVHLGDPLEDLAWALMPDWRPRQARDKVAGHITEAQAIAAWESSSGLTVDAVSLRWWSLFSLVKSVALFGAGGWNYVAHPGTDLVHAVGAWLAVDYSESQMIDMMGVLE